VTDEEHVQAIEKAQRALNNVIAFAHADSLRVELIVTEFSTINRRFPRPAISCIVSRVVN
jgi:hypothetical protein